MRAASQATAYTRSIRSKSAGSNLGRRLTAPMATSNCEPPPTYLTAMGCFGSSASCSAGLFVSGSLQLISQLIGERLRILEIDGQAQPRFGEVAVNLSRKWTLRGQCEFRTLLRVVATFFRIKHVHLFQVTDLPWSESRLFGLVRPRRSRSGARDRAVSFGTYQERYARAERQRENARIRLRFLGTTLCVRLMTRA